MHIIRKCLLCLLLILGLQCVGVYAQPLAFVTDTSNGSLTECIVTADGRLKRVGRFSLPGTSVQRQRFTSLDLSPDGRYLYVINMDGNDVLPFRVKASGGLIHLSPATIPTGPEPTAIVVAPSGKFVYISDRKAIYQFRVQSNGSLTPLCPAAAPGGDLSSSSEMDFSPDSRFLYAIAFNRGYSRTFDGAVFLRQFAVQQDGTLTPLSIPFVSAGSKPYSVAVSPNGRFAYVADFGENLILQYALRPDGTLHLLEPPSLAADPGLLGPESHTHPIWVAVAPDGNSAYMANIDNNTLSQYHIGADGKLSALCPPLVDTGDAPNFITFYTSYKGSEYVYVTCSNAVERFRRDANGRLHKLTPAYSEQGWYPTRLLFSENR